MLRLLSRMLVLSGLTSLCPNLSYSSPHAPSAWQADKLVAEGDRTCAIVLEKVVCWGSNRYGESDVPDGIGYASEIALGAIHTCALSDSDIRCWGNNEYGQLNAPDNLVNPRRLVAGSFHTCVITDLGLECWGANSDGQLDIPSDVITPVDVAAGSRHTCVINGDATVKCWGLKRWGQHYGYILLPPAWLTRPTVPPSPYVLNAQMSGGGLHTCIVGIYERGLENWRTCWGSNSWSQTSIPSWIDTSNLLELSTGMHHNCVIVSGSPHGKSVKCWGRNTQGQADPPILIGENPQHIAAGGDHSCVSTGQGVKCWGDNTHGQLEVPILK